MRHEDEKHIMIECPNTILYIYIHNEDEYSKIAIFMNNIRHVEHFGLTDIYTWCNRQQMMYETHFNYRRDFSVWKNMKSYVTYYRQKSKYQLNYQPV